MPLPLAPKNPPKKSNKPKNKGPKVQALPPSRWPDWKKKQPWRLNKRFKKRTEPPRLPSDRFIPWDEYEPDPITPREAKLLKGYMEMVHEGYRPAANRLSYKVNFGKAVVFRMWADLHIKGVVQLIDDDRTGWSHLAIHPSMWEKMGVEKPQALPPLPPVLLKRLHPTGKLIYEAARKWFDVFCYWPEGRDMGPALRMSVEGARFWLMNLADMGGIRYVSYRRGHVHTGYEEDETEEGGDGGE